MIRKSGNVGFTLVELIMIILILGILAVTAYVKMPTGMKEVAAAREFKRAVRYAQHMAMTREFTTPAEAWGLAIDGNRYTVQRANGSAEAGADYQDRYLLANSSILLGGPGIWFNGLGEPIDITTGIPLAEPASFSIMADGAGTTVSVAPATGYVD